YVYCFTCILAGPAFEYRDYEKAIDGSAYTTADGKVKKPTAVLAGLYRLLVGVACLALHMTISPLFPVKSLYDRGLLATLTYPALFGRLTMSMISDRMKFYFAWKVAEGASIMGGFGFEGYTKEGKVVGWKGVENIDILGVETASSITVLLRHWNKRTQGWLERYTYARSGRSLVATYFISALWHGLYPGFFLMFYMLAFLTTIDRLLKAKLNPLFVPGFDGRDMSTYPKGMGGSVYWLLCIAGTQVFNNYGAQAFSMGSLENSLTAFGGHYFVPHIILLSIYLLLIVVPGPKKSAKKE
ncbi:MBOAT, membrane-bound O-acyltransferase family-domain-containing protein, partial [Ochromonadaceae sp. CCMP2298]